MSLVLKDRVRETATVVGTGDAALLGAVTGFQSFSVVGNTNTCYYTIADQSGGDWEVGIGTYSTTGPTLERTTVLASSNSGSKVSFTGGTKDVFLTYPSERAVYLDASGNLVIEGGATVDGNFVVNGNTTLGNATSDTVTITGTVQPGVVIEGSSSGNALRITQTGTGNALLVEDSANPDSTPFVIDASGNVGINVSPALTGAALSISGNSTTGVLDAWRNSADSGGYSVRLFKNRNTNVYANTIVQSGDRVGSFQCYGADGTAYIEAARIQADVDGTPGTNDMPGRLVFSTTADGASSPTERMRIDSAGQVGIGGTPTAGYTLTVAKNITGAIGSYGVMSQGTVQSDVTSVAAYYRSFTNTANATFSLTTIAGYYASQGAITGGSRTAPTNQYCFWVDSSPTGATNNYGFFSNIASGTGRWNFYAAGSAANYFAGEVLLGGAVSDSSGVSSLYMDRTTASAFRIRNGTSGANGYIGAFNPNEWRVWTSTATPLTFGTDNTERMRIDSAGRVGIGNTASTQSLLIGGAAPASVTSGVTSAQQIPSSVTSTFSGFSSANSTAAASFTLALLNRYFASQGTIGAGSSITSQIGYLADSSLTGATNNYGFFSNIATGTGRWNFYAQGTADNYFAGNTGIGSLPAANIALNVTKSATGGTIAYNIVSTASVQSDVTSQFISVPSYVVTQAASFTLANLTHFNANQGPIGAGSTVTNQIGYNVAAALTGATNNYGFRSDIALGTGRWNFYAAGTAANYFAGNVGIGDTAPADNLSVYTNSATNTFVKVANTAGSTYYGVYSTGIGAVGTTSNTSFLVLTNNTERMRIDSAGRVGIGGSSYAGNTLNIAKALTGATTAQQVNVGFTINSDVTSNANVFSTYPATQAAAFTLGTLRHYAASQNTIGAGSTVTNQYGFFADPSLTGATNNFGFFSNIASGTGRWNFYAAGSADNYFAGNLLVGTTAVANFAAGTASNSALLQQGAIFVSRGSTAVRNHLEIYNPNGKIGGFGAEGTSIIITTADAGSDIERMRIDSSGNVIQTAPTTAPTLSTNGTMVFNLTSNTNLRVSVRGSDGVTRTANITLA
jgi:hypothetical protein